MGARVFGAAVIGIDLGTSNTVLAYTSGATGAPIETFLIDQLVAAGERQALPHLASVL